MKSQFTRRQAILALGASVSSATMLSGCGGIHLWGKRNNNGGGGSGGGGGSARRGAGGVAGMVLRDASGKIVLGRMTAPPPAGATPVAGARVAVENGGPNGATDKNGAFRLTKVAAGQQTLTISGGGLSAPVTVRLTVIGDTEIDIGTPPIERAAAVEAAKQALASTFPDLTAVTILAPQQPLPPGVLIIPRLDAPAIDATVPGARTVTKPTWFFFCDDRVGQPFAHTVRFVYVDAETGAAEVEEQTSWPTFNVQHFYGRAELNVTSPDMVQVGAGVTFASGPGTSSGSGGFDSDRSQKRAEAEKKMHGLWVYAFTEALPGFSPSQYHGHAGIPATVGTSLQAVWNYLNDGEKLRDVVLAKAKQLREAAAPHDTVVLDINAHGGPDKNGEYYMWMPPTANRSWYDGLTATREDEILRPADFDLPNFRACNLVIVVGTCYSGNWVNYAKSALDLPGKNVTAISASGAGEQSWGFLNDGEGARSIFIFRDVLKEQPADSGQAGLQAAFDIARQESDKYMTEQVIPKHPDAKMTSPQIWIRTKTADEDCDVAISPMKETVGTSQFVYLKVTLNNRPSGSPPVRIKVTTNLGTVSTADAAGTSIELRAEGTVAFQSAYGGDAVITAEAFETVGGKETSLGTATARIKVTAIKVTLKPATATLAPGDSVALTATLENYDKVDPGDQIVFEWEGGDRFGTLVGAPAGTAQYTAAGPNGTDTVTVKAVVLTTGGNRIELGTASSSITVNDDVPFGAIRVRFTSFDAGGLPVTGETRTLPRFETPVKILYSGKPFLGSTYQVVKSNAVKDAARMRIQFDGPLVVGATVNMNDANSMTLELGTSPSTQVFLYPRSGTLTITAAGPGFIRFTMQGEMDGRSSAATKATVIISGWIAGYDE